MKPTKIKVRKEIDMPRPEGWRKGQMVFNFLEWLRTQKGMGSNQSSRLADPFHIQDDQWDKLWEEYLVWTSDQQ